MLRVLVHVNGIEVVVDLEPRGEAVHGIRWNGAIEAHGWAGCS